MVRTIPITLLTGFLGSGKTTLLRRMLAQPGWQDTAVLVNELGEVGLDHHLMSAAGDAVVVMENGCICCSVRNDLAAVLEDLFWQRLHRKVPYFTRVVIETTGLADPGPVAAALRRNALLAQRYTLERIVCTADALAGTRTLAQHRESVAQVASADVILVTKADLAGTCGVAELEAALHGLNPLAPIRRATADSVVAELLQEVAGLPATIPPAPSCYSAGPLYHHRVATLALHFTRPWEAAPFEAALGATLARYGERILRAKGIVQFGGEAGPTVVQAVQQTLFPFEALRAWPPGTQQGFLVFITMGLDSAALAQAFRSHLDEEIQ